MNKRNFKEKQNMKYIKMFDKCAYRESRNVEDYVREDQSFFIAVDN